jgi:hypothetical protein
MAHLFLAGRQPVAELLSWIVFSYKKENEGGEWRKGPSPMPLLG